MKNTKIQMKNKSTHNIWELLRQTEKKEHNKNIKLFVQFVLLMYCFLFAALFLKF